jgi:hypothetical protein
MPAHPLTRRALIVGAGAAGVGLALPSTPALAAPLARVPALPAGQPVRTAFAPAEQLYARFLAALAPMANDINDTDTADRGFMGGGWWRTPNSPYNARVQEHTATLSWFYANERPWNPYYRDAALFGRLDAAIGHYLSLQQTDGSFPEYSRTEHSLSATGFGLGYLAKTLRNLRQAGVANERRAQLNTALQKAMGWLLNPNNGIWANNPLHWTNQIAGGLAGATVALELTPHAGLQAQLDNRMPFYAQRAQSPAGFFYEPTGMDIPYNFEVMLPDLAEIYVRNGSPIVASMAQRFADWFGYAMLREPNNVGWLTFHSASSRSDVPFYDNVSDEVDEPYFGARLIQAAPKLAAFYTSREDKAAARAAWAATPGPALPIPKGGLTQPREMSLIYYGEGYPTNAAKQAAIAQLPYLASTEWAEVRRDSLVSQDYTFVRRPKYYLGGFFGTRPTTTMRAGVGFLWHPTAGTIVYGQQTDAACWGTIAGNGPDAATSLSASYQVNGASWNGGRLNPGAGTVLVRYGRFDQTVRTDLSLTRDAVIRAVVSNTAATEQIPLVLIPGDTVTWGNGATAPHNANSSASTTSLTVRRSGITFTITWDRTANATLTTTTRTFFRDARRRLHVLRIPHTGTMTTRITIT